MLVSCPASFITQAGHETRHVPRVQDVGVAKLGQKICSQGPMPYDNEYLILLRQN